MDYGAQRIGTKHVCATPEDAGRVRGALLYHGWRCTSKKRPDGTHVVTVARKTPRPAHPTLVTLMKRAKLLDVGKSLPIGEGGRGAVEDFGEWDRGDIEEVLRTLRRDLNPRRFRTQGSNSTLIRTS